MRPETQLLGIPRCPVERKSGRKHVLAKHAPEAEGFGRQHLLQQAELLTRVRGPTWEFGGSQPSLGVSSRGTGTERWGSFIIGLKVQDFSWP